MMSIVIPDGDATDSDFEESSTAPEQTSRSDPHIQQTNQDRNIVRNEGT